MKITILNGNPDPAVYPHFDDYLSLLSQLLQESGAEVTLFPLRNMKIHYCAGCFGCWVKTPGECASPDDSADICREVIQSDGLLFASPLIQGFTSALLKKAGDKLIPLIHPYFAVVEGEAHHRARYSHYPKIGLLLEAGDDADHEDIEITRSIYSRTALNMKSQLTFSGLTSTPVEETTAALLSSLNPGSQPVRTQAAVPTTGVTIPPPARLTIFNGSPRGTKGNTPILLEQVAQGFQTGSGSVETFHLSRLSETQRHVEAFHQAECVLLGFPLYTDSMPGLVKAFIDALAPLAGKTGAPSIGFLVQSGFPEAAHSRYVEQYLKKLAQHLGSPYLGCIVKGGCEGVHRMPESMNRKLFTGLQSAGQGLAQFGRLDPSELKQMAQPERVSAFWVPVYQLLVKTPLLSFYWDGQLKENGAYQRRFARPYKK